VSESSRTNRYSNIAYQNLSVVAESGEELSCECPFCGAGTALYFNDVKGLWVCFKCGEKGTAKSLVEMLDGSYKEPEYEVEYLSEQLRSLSTDVNSGREFLRPISDGQLRRFRKQGDIHERWAARGFDAALCDRYELGYDFLGDALTLPYRDPATGHASGVIRRRLGSGDGPRYLFPTGFNRRGSLYGSWIVAAERSSGFRPATEPVIVTEGPTDAIRSDQGSGLNATAQYGSSISAGQIRLLHRLGVENLILFYDYDRAGLSATEKGEELASEFIVQKVRWDRKRFCWHRIVCGCHSATKDKWLEHTKYLHSCPHQRLCKCGRIHEPDPCSLDLPEISRMIERRVEV
jgi:DNA primase